MKAGRLEKGDGVLVSVADIRCSMDPYYLSEGVALAPASSGNALVMVYASVVSDECDRGTVEIEWDDVGDDWGRCYMPNDCCFLVDNEAADYLIKEDVDFEYMVYEPRPAPPALFDRQGAPDERAAGHSVAAAVKATRAGDKQSAVDHMRRAASLSFAPGAAAGGGNLYTHNVLLLLGEAYDRNGQHDMARRTYQLATDQRPWPERGALAKEFGRRGHFIRVPA